MFGHYGATSMAREALRQSEENRTDQVKTSTILQQHVDKCDKSAENLRSELIEREHRAQEWRVGLGHRLDSLDGSMRWIFRGVLAVLFAIIAFLVEHSGVFDHH